MTVYARHVTSLTVSARKTTAGWVVKTREGAHLSFHKHPNWRGVGCGEELIGFLIDLTSTATCLRTSGQLAPWEVNLCTREVIYIYKKSITVHPMPAVG